MVPRLTSVVTGLVVLGVVLWPLEQLFPVRRQRWLRGELTTDLAYWFLTPFVTRWLTRAALMASILLLAAAAGIPLDGEHVKAFAANPGRAAQRQPVGIQVLEVLILGDFIGYWTHRVFHGRPLWAFHAVHHSSRELDWLSSVRLHPVNDIGSRLASALPVFLLGFSPKILAAYVPFLTLYAIVLHANLPWTFGPLRYVLASPAFHRWHHAADAEGRDRNFAGLLPIIDLVFGTFHMPPGRVPEALGLPEDEIVPSGLVAQLLYPFRR
ncbi:MAG TPA: sterol desaturase family protein [Myxococcota bacterium]|nr:sterol desaturase family protein [Myxococcota bacterium]